MRIKRSDSVVDATPVAGNLIRPVKPQFLSLVNKPANQTAFKVMRSAQGETPMTKMLRRTRRSDVSSSPVLRLTFPEGSTVETAAEALATYGMEGYTVQEDGGRIVALRSDLKSFSPDDAVQIKLSEAGLIADVQRSAPLSSPESAPGDKTHIALVAFEFDATKFTSDEVSQWMAEKAVDGELLQPQNSDTCYVVRRSEVSEVEETRKMVVEDGVTAVIARSDDPNIPDGYVAVVSEAAYGSWGWGQLDFTAAMADAEFSEHMDDGIYRLRRVLEQILLYSPLPLDVRQDLASRALLQFGEFVGALMESLPRQLLVSVVRSATPNSENHMTQKTPGDGGTSTQATAQPATPAPAAPEAVTRADLDQFRKDLLAEIGALVTRSAEPETPATEPAESAAPATEPAPASLTRSDVDTLLAEKLQPLSEAVEKLSGLTVVRSEGDTAGKPGAKTNAKREDTVFRGAIFGNVKPAE